MPLSFRHPTFAALLSATGLPQCCHSPRPPATQTLPTLARENLVGEHIPRNKPRAELTPFKRSRYGQSSCEADSMSKRPLSRGFQPPSYVRSVADTFGPLQPEEKKESPKKKTSSKKKSAEPGSWPCKINGCNKVFAREADLKRHQRTTKLHSMPGL